MTAAAGQRLRENARNVLRVGATRLWSAANGAGLRRRLERRFAGYDDAGRTEGFDVLGQELIRRPAFALAPLHPDDPAAAAYARRMAANYPRETTYAFGVARLDDARVQAPHCVHVAAAGIFARHHCGPAVFDNPKYALPQHLLPLRRPRARHAAGILLCPSWHHNFYHWVVDILPRLSMIEGIDAPLVVPAGLRPFARRYLELLGHDRAVRLDDGVHAFVRLYLPGNMTPTFDYSDHKRRFHQEVVLPRARAAAGSGEAGRRLYLSRADAASRRVLDEEALVARLPGFEPVQLSRLGVAEQATAFAGAEAVVGPHGAAFANLVYCRPGTQVVEIFQEGHFNPCYARLSEALGLRYGFMIAAQRGLHLEVRGDTLADLMAEIGAAPA